MAGRFADDEWRWVYSDRAIPSHELPWYEEEQLEDVMCLNLDRASHETALLYGLDCSVQQGVMCVQPAQNKSVAVTAGDLSLQVVYPDSNVTWQQALDMCRDDTGGLLTAVDTNQLAEIVKQLGELYHSHSICVNIALAIHYKNLDDNFLEKNLCRSRDSNHRSPDFRTGTLTT